MYVKIKKFPSLAEGKVLFRSNTRLIIASVLLHRQHAVTFDNR